MDFWGFSEWDGVLEMCAKESFEAEQEINGDGDGDSQLETSLLKEIFCRNLAKKKGENISSKNFIEIKRTV